ncbi:precorrin-3B C(17)-methyltransferase [Paraburkholderia kururiensis]|uniref:Precorrin-3B C(17)-methyltransferase n=1 Tax=Paraburkholderia kururiensis TaxID=984307 RepID=A0ABZ0WKS0_9BURK|nr:precorrin-3B C(17)-methyltransferase [Paraburkholderia kururiensis]WQD77901.1 precorrin-3B C(17)-methyltransferase [Paraburkholderia kururiensis]
MARVSTPPAIVVLGPGALGTARRIQACYAGAQLHGLHARVDADVTFTELGVHLRTLYAQGTPIVVLCAAGIVIRSLAPALANKGSEPPVLAVAEDGSAVVPLLGGLAGVNVMAREIAAALGVAPAITTSGELRFGTCLLNPPEGYALASLEQGKRFVSDLLAGEHTRIEGEAPWLDRVPLPVDESARLTIRVTAQASDERRDELVVHPKSVVAAVWASSAPDSAHAACNDGAAHDLRTNDNASGEENDLDATDGAIAARRLNSRSNSDGERDSTGTSITNAAASIVHRVREALRAQGLAPLALAALLTPEERMDDEALEEAARSLGVPLRFSASADATLQGSAPHERAGQLLRAALRVPHDIHTHRNGIALAVASQSVTSALPGKARGRVTVVGLGPGSADLMVPAARAALADATDVLGYATYVNMAGPFRDDQRVHPTDNREELQRARHAFALASEGRRVAIVSSGDPGVFAMAAAVLEALDTADDPRWRKVALAIVPGISAAMATAAQAGAPLGHDFCMLSLSDNLKPWRIIEQRLRHAAEADLVMAFYNPISRARPWQLDRALDIVRGYRAPQTRVVLGRDIGRPGATLVTTTLGALRADQVDMRTMVIVGSSTTRGVAGGPHGEWIYTPRWYEA